MWSKTNRSRNTGLRKPDVSPCGSLEFLGEGLPAFFNGILTFRIPKLNIVEIYYVHPTDKEGLDMAKEKILVVEDEEAIQELIRYNLNKEGFDRVRLCDSGEAALAQAAEFKPDLILLDMMLPGIDGLSVCRRLRRDARTAAVPIIMLTAKSEESDIVTGLEVGADDYLAKPFSPKVLIARIKSVLRRVNPTELEESSTSLKRGVLTMNRGTREAAIDGHALSLTFSEFEILYLLARRPGWVFTRNQIVNEVKGDDYPVTERAVDVQMVSLRRKLGGHGDLIETVRGVGYRFAQE